LLEKKKKKKGTMDQNKTNHIVGLLDAGRDLNQEFIMPTTRKRKKKN